MNRPYALGGTQQLLGSPVQFPSQQFSFHYPPQSVVGLGSLVKQGVPSQATKSVLSKSHGKLSTSLGYIGNGYANDETQQIQQKLSQHRGIHGYYPDNLAGTVLIRKGGQQSIFTTGDNSKTLSEYPSHISEHIQRSPHTVLDSYQDAEGLDIIRIQATRVSNLLDRIEILDKEVERQSDLLKDKQKEIDYLARKYKEFEHKRKQSKEEIDTFNKPQYTKKIKEFVEDKQVDETRHNQSSIIEKTKNENLLLLKLREIEDINNEVAYWKSKCIPNDHQSSDIKRLQQNHNDLLGINKDLNKRLLIVSHQQRMQ